MHEADFTGELMCFEHMVFGFMFVMLLLTCDENLNQNSTHFINYSFFLRLVKYVNAG
jgi:hypothetical protein